MDFLEQNVLMTPMLIDRFGAVFVETIEAFETTTTYKRTSVIRQKSTGRKILDAELTVFKNAVPKQIIEALKATNTPFGQMLISHNIDVKIENKRLITATDEVTKLQRKGRSVHIVDAVSDVLICSVSELMAA